MINGDPNDFLESIYSCQDTTYSYNEKSIGFKVIPLQIRKYTLKYFSIIRLWKNMYGSERESR